MSYFITINYRMINAKVKDWVERPANNEKVTPVKVEDFSVSDHGTGVFG